MYNIKNDTANHDGHHYSSTRVASLNTTFVANFRVMLSVDSCTSKTPKGLGEGHSYLGTQLPGNHFQGLSLFSSVCAVLPQSVAIKDSAQSPATISLFQFNS